MADEILEALRAAVAAKVAYWDAMGELEVALNCEDPPGRVSDRLVTEVDGLAINVSADGGVGWISEGYAVDLENEVREMMRDFNEEAGNE